MSLMDALSPQQPSAPPPPSAPSAPPSAPNGNAAPVQTPTGAPPPADALTTPAPGKTEMGGNGGPDWRAMLAGEDTDAIKDLSRYQSPTELLKAFKEQRAALSKRAEPVKLGDNPTPEQVAAYRKAQGVPEIAADAPPEKIAEAYGIKPPEGYEMSSTEKGMISEFAKTMYGKHAPPALVKEATDYFFKQNAAMAQAVRKDTSEKAKTWKNSLIDRHGTKEYEAQQAAASTYLRNEFKDNPDEMANILNAQLPGGGVLGDHPWFFENLAKQALGAGFGDRIEANAMEASGKSLAVRHSELVKLYHTDRKLYNAPQTQAELLKVVSLRQSRGELDAQGEEIKRR